MDLSSSVASMTFTENQQGSSILNKLKAQKERGRFCDVVFHVEGKEYLAHRNVLAACSPYFDSMLKMNSIAKEHLTIACENHEVFEVLLDYVYTGKVVIDKQAVSELLRLANHFLITNLKDYCCEFLERNLSVTTCFGVKEQADKYGCPTLAQAVHCFITCAIADIIKEDEVLNFNFAQIEKLLTNKLYTLDSNEKVQLILHWTKHNLKEREPFFPFLLSLVEWADVNVESIYNSLKSDDWYINSNSCFYHLLKILQDNGIDLTFYADILQQLQEKITTGETNIGSPETVNYRECVEDVQTDSVHIQDEVEIDTCTDDGTEREVDETLHLHSVGNKNDESDDDSKICAGHENVCAVGEGSNPAQSSFASKARGRPHKRKGIPVKMKIHKAKVCVNVPIVRPRRRGRPPKRLYLDEPKTMEDSRDETEEEALIIDDNGNAEARTSSAEDCNAITEKKAGKNKRTRKKREYIKCSKCFYVGHSEMQLTAHINNAHMEDQTYSCTICLFSCHWNREYYRHMKTHFPGPPYKCDLEQCSYGAERIQALLYHRMTHGDERPFQCSVCSQKFRTKTNLNSHLRSHRGEKPFKCEVCDRCFATKGTLEQHSVTHSDHRPYLCDMCGFATKYQSHLISHKRLHTGEVFHCDFPGCSYFSPKRSQLGCHMRIHLPIRSHLCSTCGRGFVEKSHLVRHQRIHLEDKPFKCSFCDYCSTRRDKLKDHTVKHHGENASGSSKLPYKPRRQRQSTIETNPLSGLNTVLNLEMVEPKEEVKSGMQLNVSAPVASKSGDDEDVGIGMGDMDLMNSAVMADGAGAIITSTGIRMFSQAATIDTRGLGLLLPTVVAMDSRHSHEQQQQQDNVHMAVGLLDHTHSQTQSENPLTPANQPSLSLITNGFINQHNSIHLQQLQTQQFQQHQIQQEQTSHTQNSSDIPGLTSLMGIF